MGFLLRKPILALSGSDKIRRQLVKAPVTRKVVDRFIAGDTTADAVSAVRRLRAAGLDVTLDYLGEGVSNLAGAATTVRAYTELIRALEAAELVEGAEVSVKLSAIGLSLPDGESIVRDHAAMIVKAAYSVGARVTIDMEDHSTVDATLRVVNFLRLRQADVGVAIQAMLHRTPDDLAVLTGPSSRVRLVKGAYNEPTGVAHQDAAEVDLAYVRALRQLMASDGYPMVGSHDPRLIAIAKELAEENGRGGLQQSNKGLEFQMLFGIRPEEQLRLRSEGHKVRVYVPYGTDWYGYFTRRLAERPANLLFFARSLISKR